MSDPSTILIHYLTTFKSDESEISTHIDSTSVSWSEEEYRIGIFESPSLQVTITDFSPEWDFCDGGAKMLLCYKTEGNVDPMCLQVCFGQKAVATLVV